MERIRSRAGRIVLAATAVQAAALSRTVAFDPDIII